MIVFYFKSSVIRHIQINLQQHKRKYQILSECLLQVMCVNMVVFERHVKIPRDSGDLLYTTDVDVKICGKVTSTKHVFLIVTELCGQLVKASKNSKCTQLHTNVIIRKNVS